MTDIAKVEHKVMGLNDNKIGEQSNGLKVEVAIFIFIIIVVVVIIGFLIAVGWPMELPDKSSNLRTVEAIKDYLEQRERLRPARLQFVTTIAAILGGIGVVFNLYYTGKREEAFNKSAIAANKSADAALENAKAALKNAEAAQDKQITERFTKAVEQLARQEIAIRLGGIYALERIAKNSEDDHWTIMEVLTAFVRENRPLKEEEQEEKEQFPKIPTDIQAALTVIRRRNCENEEENQRLDLHNTDIRGADFRGANLRGADLTEANLRGADLSGANLREAKLFKANLERAYLRQAKLQEAVLCQARLHEADLTEANLEKAHLMQAKLPGTDLNGAKLKSANLGGANLHQTTLFKANLENANLTGAILKEAVFREANLQGVDFSDANLEGANLSEAKNLKQEQIEKAFGNKNTTRLPENLKAPEHWTKSK
jgi:uncharacterized protein YjbI with pentapeptide repeats